MLAIPGTSRRFIGMPAVQGGARETDRAVVIVSPHFPPSTLAGVHRARHLAKHLPSHGWRPIIVRVDERHYSEPNDEALAGLVPDDVAQVRTSAIDARFARMAGIGDVGLRGYLAIKQALARVIPHNRPAAVLITGSPFYPMLLSRWIRQTYAVPVVLDFQDPWVSAEGGTRPRWSKGGLSHQLALALEPRALRSAAFVTSVSDVQNDEMANRYRWWPRERMAAIPIGGDPGDFDAVRTGEGALSPLLSQDKINISYVGTYWPRAERPVRALLRAIAALRATHPQVAAGLQFNFVGTSGRPGAGGASTVKPVADELGIGDMMAEVPQRVPYLEAIAVMAQSDGLIVFGSDEPHYTASKVFPVLMSGRPYVSLLHQASSGHSALSSAGGGMALSFSDASDLEAMVPSIADALVQLATSPARWGLAKVETYASGNAHGVAGRFAEVFARVSDGVSA